MYYQRNMVSGRFLPLILLVAVAYLSSTTWVSAEVGIDEGNQELNRLEDQVNTLKMAAEENYLRRCGRSLYCFLST